MCARYLFIECLAMENWELNWKVSRPRLELERATHWVMLCRYLVAGVCFWVGTRAKKKKAERVQQSSGEDEVS